MVVDVGDPVKAFIARGRVDAADSGDCLVSAGAAQGRKYSGMGRVRPFHLRCKTSSTSAVRGKYSGMGRVRPFHLRCKTSGTSAVRGQLQVFQLCSCEAVVSSLTGSCRARPLCLAVQVLRQWPCEAIVSSAQVSGSGRAKPLCLRCASPPAVAVRGGCTLSLLDKPSGRGRARQSCLLFKSPAVAVRSRCLR